MSGGLIHQILSLEKNLRLPRTQQGSVETNLRVSDNQRTLSPDVCGDESTNLENVSTYVALLGVCPIPSHLGTATDLSRDGSDRRRSKRDRHAFDEIILIYTPVAVFCTNTLPGGWKLPAFVILVPAGLALTLLIAAYSVILTVGIFMLCVALLFFFQQFVTSLMERLHTNLFTLVYGTRKLSKTEVSDYVFDTIFEDKTFKSRFFFPNIPSDQRLYGWGVADAYAKVSPSLKNKGDTAWCVRYAVWERNEETLGETYICDFLVTNNNEIHFFYGFDKVSFFNPNVARKKFDAVRRKRIRGLVKARKKELKEEGKAKQKVEMLQSETQASLEALKRKRRNS